MKSAIVFGGSGFLGSYVVEELVQKNYHVINADIVKPKYPIDQQEFVGCDILDEKALEALISKDIGIVYNFAGLADINVSIHRPLETAKLNVLGNLNILEACRKAAIERFIYASSIYVYSDKSSFYGISKETSEKLIEEYWVQYGLPFTILRFGSLYGERADSNNGIYRLIEQAVKTKKITYPGSGEEIRELIHARDAARLSVKILDEDYKNKRLILTGTEKIRIRDLLLMIKEILRNDVEIEYDEREYKGHYTVTPYLFSPKIGEKLTINPFVDLGQGLLECISNFFNGHNGDIKK